jgi:hypothetical protein
MVWAGITATGKTPLVFVERGVKINAAYYQKHIIREVLDSWVRNHFGNRPWTLQQDWAPSHSAKSIIQLCKRMFPDVWDKKIWPSKSCDLNPMDYSVWSILEKKVSTKNYATVGALKRALVKAWDEITPEQCSCIIDNFPKRLKACIEAKGGLFENLLK